MSDQENPTEEIQDASTERYRDQLVAPSWPRDVYGITSGLRRELARVAGRLNGDRDKMEVFMATVREGAKWAQSRMEIQLAARQKQIEAAMLRDEEMAAQEAQNASTDDIVDRQAAQRAAGIGGAVYSTAQ